jgi:Domain of unknown function (DUF4149)
VSRSTRLQSSALLVAAWLGAAIITVAVVAPGAFAVLPSRTLAGEMVGRVLPALFIAGNTIGLIVAVLVGTGERWGAARGAATAAALAALACAVSQFIITPRLDRLRAEIAGPVDVLPADDARRVAFGLLHGYNVAGLGVSMLGAAVCLGFLLYAMRSRG